MRSRSEWGSFQLHPFAPYICLFYLWPRFQQRSSVPSVKSMCLCNCSLSSRRSTHLESLSQNGTIGSYDVKTKERTDPFSLLALNLGPGWIFCHSAHKDFITEQQHSKLVLFPEVVLVQNLQVIIVFLKNNQIWFPLPSAANSLNGLFVSNILRAKLQSLTSEMQQKMANNSTISIPNHYQMRHPCLLQRLLQVFLLLPPQFMVCSHSQYVLWVLFGLPCDHSFTLEIESNCVDKWSFHMWPSTKVIFNDRQMWMP